MKIARANSLERLLITASNDTRELIRGEREMGKRERQLSWSGEEIAELKMDVLREREVKDSLERQLQDEQKVRVVYQKRLKKERRARKRLQEQLDLEIKRRTQLEEALKATGASSEQVRAITENVTAEARTSSEPPEASPVHSQSQQQSSQQQPPQQPLQQQQAAAQQYREAQVPRPSQQPSTPEKPAWGYGLDLIGSQASAFWQNYQGTTTWFSGEQVGTGEIGQGRQEERGKGEGSRKVEFRSERDGSSRGCKLTVRIAGSGTRAGEKIAAAPSGREGPSQVSSSRGGRISREGGRDGSCKGVSGIAPAYSKLGLALLRGNLSEGSFQLAQKLYP
ncbi:Dachshund like protein 1 [Atta colombica]|uniref:Dachshund like protein 1 n=1 Tax=Atta colombica TaxID=520822 RepID=A0A195B2F4_9HYME|nr:Dachshund like protein 1 [Atta colombica]